MFQAWWHSKVWLLSLAATLQLAAHSAPEPMVAPALKPGEGFAITLGDGEVHAYGEARRESPMGSLSKLVWMRLEGSEWTSKGVSFKCTGKAGAFACWKADGHGRLDVGKALQADCDLAFLLWIADSETHWKKEYGEAAARYRMEEVFSPFLGRRLAMGDTLPPLSSAWVGQGDLLRTSPEAFLQWLMEPQQSEVVTFGKRFLAGQWVEMKELFGKEGWWFKTATAPVPGEPSATSAWVVGGNASTIAVLHLPRGKGHEEGLARLREILRLKK